MLSTVKSLLHFPSLLAVDCGVPPPIPHSVMLWDNISTVGSQVVYQCNSGYRSVGKGNASICTASGEWDAASLLCQGDNDVTPPPPMSHNLHAAHRLTSGELPVTFNDLSFCHRN